MDRFAYSSAPVKRVKGIQFGVLDPQYLVPPVPDSSWGCIAAASLTLLQRLHGGLQLHCYAYAVTACQPHCQAAALLHAAAEA